MAPIKRCLRNLGCPEFRFGSFFDSTQLVSPQTLESFGPLVKRPDSVTVSSIHHVPPVAPHPDQSHLPQYPEMLRDGRLFQTKLVDNVSYRSFSQCKKLQDFATARFGHCIKAIGGRGCPRHARDNIFPYQHVSNMDLNVRSSAPMLQLNLSPHCSLCSVTVTLMSASHALRHCAHGIYCGSGGTGRHTILRGWRRKAWGFKSPLPHQSTYSHATKGRPVGWFGLTMTFLIYLAITVHIIVCFFLIVVVLLQSGKSGDVAAAFGGMGSQTAFGPRGAASALSKATTWSAVLFMITSITLSVFASRRGAPSGSILSGTKPAQTTSQPAQPAPTPAAPATPQQQAPAPK